MTRRCSGGECLAFFSELGGDIHSLLGDLKAFQHGDWSRIHFEGFLSLEVWRIRPPNGDLERQKDPGGDRGRSSLRGEPRLKGDRIFR